MQDVRHNDDPANVLFPDGWECMSWPWCSMPDPCHEHCCKAALLMDITMKKLKEKP
jgi:prepilin-type processing-associated H-X9-DG protein